MHRSYPFICLVLLNILWVRMRAENCGVLTVVARLPPT